MSKQVAWSYSALTSFETCPHRHNMTRIQKQVIEPQTDAIKWGLKVHKGLEDRLKSGTPLAAGLEQYEPIAAKLEAAGKGRKVVTEQKLALNKNLNSVTYFAKDVWVRSILDLAIEDKSTALIVDHKTGKPTPESAQLRLSAAVYMAANPYIEKVTSTFLWLKTGGALTEKFTRADIPAIWQEFMPRVQRLEQAHEANVWPKRPSGLCRNYCPLDSKQCEHSGKV